MPGSPSPWLRASHADRDHVVAQLREHLAAGRLTTDEFRDRMGLALSAKTFGDLAPLLADLPGSPGLPHPPDPPDPLGPPHTPRLSHAPEPSHPPEPSHAPSRPAEMWLTADPFAPPHPASSAPPSRRDADRFPLRLAVSGVIIAIYIACGVAFSIWWLPWFAFVIPIILIRHLRDR